MKGKTSAIMVAAIMPDVDAEMLVRASKWLDETIERNPAFEGGSFAIIEALQEVCTHFLGICLEIPLLTKSL